jgi:SAM-dependent methyltransferase
MHREAGFPLDYGASGYAYVERPNSVLLELLSAHVLSTRPAARILDIGCGAGANARRIAERAPLARVVGVEPNAHAAQLARGACSEVFEGTLEAFIACAPHASFDAVLLSDVLEHTVDPIGFLQSLVRLPALRRATLVVSVPNYAVWYNRLRTLAGRFEYTWSGLYDRTHLRFFTRRSLRKALDYAGFEVLADDCTPSVVQCAAPILRRFFEREVASGDHLALGNSRAFTAYQCFVEPLEQRLCSAWPELLGFQIVCVATPR